jgi:D-arabinose 1-dehydrogenase-like Zn-dependent alcohol dehydrogenase
MTAPVRSAQIPKVRGEPRLIDLPPTEVGPEQVPASGHACGICHSDHKNTSSQMCSRPQSRRRTPMLHCRSRFNSHNSSTNISK